MQISFYTLGCKLNQAETEDLKQALVKLGFFVVPFSKKADVSIIRACGVTCNASQTTREMIRKAKRNGSHVIAMGCLENKLPEVDFVAKTNEEAIEQIINLNEEVGSLSPNNPSEEKHLERTRAFIKIQTGCNFNCSYCIIPHFRGRSTSVPMNKIIQEINGKVNQGFSEIILTGVNICQYKDKKLSLSDLLKIILEKTKIKRVRLGSLDPRLITKDLIELYSDKKITERLMPHWHLSLQSGSDNILKSMNRLYTSKQYLKIVETLREKNSYFSFTTDIIVGFPGETEKDFADTCELLEKIQFTKVHVFPFSSRPGTPAEKMKQIPDKTKTEMAKKLIQISKKVEQKFIEAFVGETRPVLFENKKSGYTHGYTPEFVRVKIKSEKNLKNKIESIIIQKSILQL